MHLPRLHRGFGLRRLATILCVALTIPIGTAHAAAPHARPEGAAAAGGIFTRGATPATQRTRLAQETESPAVQPRTPLGGPGDGAEAPGPPRRPGAVPIVRQDATGLAEGFARLPEIALRPGGFDIPDLAASNDFQADDIFAGDDNTVILQGNVRLWLPDTTFEMDRLAIRETDEADFLHAQGNVRVEQGESVLMADDLEFTIPRRTEEDDADDLPDTYALFESAGVPETATQVSRGSFIATGVHLVEPERELTADMLSFDFQTSTGEIYNAWGRADIFFFGAEHILLLGEEDMEAEAAWVTTCDCDHDYYKVHFDHLVMSGGEVLQGRGVGLEVARVRLPISVPRWSWQSGEQRIASMELRSGRYAGTGYYINFAQRFFASPDIELGYRLYPTENEGVGVGFEGAYDFMNTPTSPLFRSEGDFRMMYTTKERGHLDFFHRQELLENTVLMLHWEQWSDPDFIKDFYYNQMYRNRTEPRTVANVTMTEDDYIASATVRKRTNNFVTETERLPEAAFNLLERPIHDNIYLSFDAVAGYNEREPGGDSAFRSVNRLRLTFDPELSEAYAVTPFVEFDASWYSETRSGGSGSTGRASALAGVTASTRFHRTFGGALGFSAFKHIVIPSLTLSYRPSSSLDFEETPRFDALDDVRERTRLEGSVSNILLGRDGESGEVWPVGRLNLHFGTDFANELRNTADYELEMDIRPRPWWGVQAIAQRHKESDRLDLGGPFAREQIAIRFYERVLQPFLGPLDEELLARYGASRGDFDRVLAFIYYNNELQDAPWNGRLGFAYTKTRDEVFNREILFGLGYRISEAWSVAFEHRYDFEQGKFVRQRYEIRRNLDCVSWTLRVEDRRSGIDINLGFAITAFPGSLIRF